MTLRRNALALAALLALALVPPAAAQLQPLVPKALRGRIDAERSGQHDANNIRTVFWNYGMVGDYPADPANVDLSVFHSVEVPKGSGMDYADGITPFVLDKITQTSGIDAYVMETGYRERQATSPYNASRVMRFEPRPGWFQPDPTINRGRSPAISNDPRTWPNVWPDKVNDPDDPGWHGSWDGYFGKRAAADQESFMVVDDDFYEAWDYYPDSRSPCCTDSTRHGFGLRVEVRGFQWSNPQAGNVIFWHYDVVNESTTDYDNIIFGLYMDSGVGGSQLGCDGVYESDDDNAYWDKSYPGLNLVYTWDRYGHGVDLTSICAPTGYLGYAYLETPGNPYDGIDNDNDGITDERRDSGPGVKIVGQDSIMAYVQAHYNVAKFEAFYGPIKQRPAYKAGVWWTGDEDMDWTAEFDDVGADGIPGTHDTGEGDGIPTEGEPDFDRTDKDESDQIGLTGFKMNRIKAGLGNPDPTVDGIVFYTDQNNWPQRLYEKFTDPFVPARFDSAVAANYNIAFLFASGPFKLLAGKQERFSLALAFGADLQELRQNVHTVQLHRSRVPGPAHHQQRAWHRPDRERQADRPVRSQGRHQRLLAQDHRRRGLLAGVGDRDHPHLDRHHGHQRAGLLLRRVRLQLRLRPGARLAGDLPVGERDHGVTHPARRAHPAPERGGDAPQCQGGGLHRGGGRARHAHRGLGYRQRRRSCGELEPGRQSPVQARLHHPVARQPAGPKLHAHRQHLGPGAVLARLRFRRPGDRTGGRRSPAGGEHVPPGRGGRGAERLGLRIALHRHADRHLRADAGPRRRRHQHAPARVPGQPHDHVL